MSWTDKGTILLTENDRKTRKTRTWVLNADWSAPRKLWDRKQQDAYTQSRARRCVGPGRKPFSRSATSIYLSGQGASAQGDRPFVDTLNLSTLATERIFRSDDKPITKR